MAQVSSTTQALEKEAIAQLKGKRWVLKINNRNTNQCTQKICLQEFNPNVQNMHILVIYIVRQQEISVHPQKIRK